MCLSRSAGETSLTYQSLALDVTTIPLFVGATRVRHVLSESSPLHGLRTVEDLSRLGVASFQALIFGTEEVYGHVVYARQIYNPSEIRFGVRFVRILDVQVRARPHLPPSSPFSNLWRVRRAHHRRAANRQNHSQARRAR